MKDSTLTQRIEFILSASHPVAVGNGEISDLSEYTEVYSDGQFSDSGFNIYCHEGALIRKDWSRYQGEGTYYRPYTLSEYMELMPTEAAHFDRWADGLRDIVIG